MEASGCSPHCSANFLFSRNCSPTAPMQDQFSIQRSPKSRPTSKPKSSNAPIVPKGSCHYPSVGSSNVRSLGWNCCRRPAKDWENRNRNALAFLKLASIRLMLRKLCNPLIKSPDGLSKGGSWKRGNGPLGWAPLASTCGNTLPSSPVAEIAGWIIAAHHRIELDSAREDEFDAPLAHMLWIRDRHHSFPSSRVNPPLPLRMALRDGVGQGHCNCYLTSLLSERTPASSAAFVGFHCPFCLLCRRAPFPPADRVLPDSLGNSCHLPMNHLRL